MTLDAGEDKVGDGMKQLAVFIESACFRVAVAFLLYK
jgi:hypothetical protein